MKRAALLLVLLGFVYFFCPQLAFPFSFALVIGPPNSDRWKLLSQKDWSPGGDVKFTLEDLGKYRFRSFLIYVSLPFNKSGAASFGTLATEVPFNAIRYVTWQDKLNVKRIPARVLRQISHLMYRGVDTQYSAPTATNGLQTPSFSLLVDNEYYGTDAPDISILDLARAGENAALVLTCGTVEDLIAGGDYTTKTFTVAGAILIYEQIEESRELRAFPFSNFHYEYIEKSVNSNPQAEYKVPIPIDQDVRFIFFGQSTRTPDTLISTLVAAANNVRVDVNDEPRYGPITFQELTRRNQADYLVAFNTGYGVVDFTKNKAKKKLSLLVPDQNDPDRIKTCNLVVQTSSVASAYLDVLVASIRGPIVQVR